MIKSETGHARNPERVDEDIKNMPWTLAIVSTLVVVAWLLALCAAKITTRIIARSRRQFGLHATPHGGTSALADSPREGDDADPQGRKGLRAHLGWFWLVVAYEHSGSDIKIRGQPGFKTRSHRTPVRSFITAFYTLGTLCVLVAFLAIPAYLVRELYCTLFSVHIPVRGIRTAEDSEPVGLLVPGLTIPLRDWFILFLASFTAIAWHEAGHALTAMIAEIPITSFAFILIFAFPGAYVALDGLSLDALPSTGKLRIISAGVWHNFLLCLFISLGMRTGSIGRDSAAYRYLGYTPMEEYGVVIQRLSQDSPLNGLLRQQQLLTHLNDVELHDSHIYGHWKRYLLSNLDEDYKYDNLGFCLDQSLYSGRPVDCCLQEYRSDQGQTAAYENQQVCYVESRQIANYTDGIKANEIAQGHCLDPSEILDLPRCTTTCSQDNHICIHPSPLANLLRITARNDNTGADEIILYRGPKTRLWKDIKVGRYLAPSRYFRSLPLDIESFWLYTSSISLTLALFNLLPFPRLDGTEILDTLLSIPTSPFAPILPLVRGTKTGSMYDQNVGGGGRLDRILHASVSILQSALMSGTGRLDHRQRAVKRRYARVIIQGTVGSLAGLSMLGNIYRQLYVDS